MKRVSVITLAVILITSIIPATLAFQMERPGSNAAIGKTISQKNTNGEASVGIGATLNSHYAPPNDYGANFMTMPAV